MKYIYSSFLSILLCVVLLLGCSSSEEESITKKEATQIAITHLEENSDRVNTDNLIVIEAAETVYNHTKTWEIHLGTSDDRMPVATYNVGFDGSIQGYSY